MTTDEDPPPPKLLPHKLEASADDDINLVPLKWTGVEYEKPPADDGSDSEERERCRRSPSPNFDDSNCVKSVPRTREEQEQIDTYLKRRVEREDCR